MYRDRLSSVVCVPTLSRELHTLYMLVSILPDGSLLRSDRNRDRLGAGQPRRANTLRHRLLGRPRDLEKFSLFFSGRTERSTRSRATPPGQHAPTSTTWPATGLLVDCIPGFDSGTGKRLSLDRQCKNEKQVGRFSLVFS